MPFWKKKSADNREQPRVIEIQWGGYYASKGEGGKYGVFRLLDFNKDVYHGQMFTQKFDHKPTADEVTILSPFVWHAPVAAAGLLNLEELTLVGHKPLTDQDLVGYVEYHHAHGVEEARIAELCARLKEYSNQEPLKLRLERTPEGGSVAVNRAE